MLKYEDAPLGNYVKCPLLDRETIPSGDCFFNIYCCRRNYT